MLIGSQTLRPGTFNHHLVKLKHKKSSGKKELALSLLLTPMVEMFSLLVIFLLMVFSSSPEILSINKDVMLPSAITGSEIQDAPVLALTAEKVFLDQVEIGEIVPLLRNPRPLMKKLASLRRAWQKGNPGQTFPGKVHLQADRSIESTTVSRFMAMLPSQAYGSIQLAVVGGSRGGNP